ncbi:MAG TPA: hypothetical protein PK331_11970 [Gordonia sp. (in: high G+C Gram-positive bacteria)]|nr:MULTISPECIES: hypothetical protein [unclassified Gordonia (in: high G+C Gram-positive bacteria)]RUP37062.1 MAG: hypothetical protein EKK60_13280 [Gordonia sp. (in: high G+C Gram-positive bacteria)]HNP55425.1 hypothetical protein [Gordonia sp. (in: high G+C Gram-positive bacteria)]HRC51621.1 hypothetical protein [Gordonia sp. (in: high G+C Gram-positive bacteria)]
MGGVMVPDMGGAMVPDIGGVIVPDMGAGVIIVVDGFSDFVLSQPVSSSAPAAVTASATPANMRGRVVVVLDMGPPKQGDGNSGLCSSLAIRRRAG